MNNRNIYWTLIILLSGLISILTCYSNDGKKLINQLCYEDFEKDFYCRRDTAYTRMRRNKLFIGRADSIKFHNRWRKKWREEGGVGPYRY